MEGETSAYGGNDTHTPVTKRLKQQRNVQEEGMTQHGGKSRLFSFIYLNSHTSVTSVPIETITIND